MAGEFFVPFPSEMRPVRLSCFSLLLFSSAFSQVTAEPVDQFQSSLMEKEGAVRDMKFRKKNGASVCPRDPNDRVTGEM